MGNSLKCILSIRNARGGANLDLRSTLEKMKNDGGGLALCGRVKLTTGIHSLALMGYFVKFGISGLNGVSRDSMRACGPTLELGGSGP